MPRERILILAGTTEARHLANVLIGQGHDVVSSFAGVTTRPLLPSGTIHTGGFGGVAGLAAFLHSERITTLVDGTHPFAAQISRHALEAARATGVPLMRLERPAWSAQVGDTWHIVESLEEAAKALPSNARVLLTTGRKELLNFLRRDDLAGIIRTIEPPAEPLPPHWTLLLDRPPHSLDAEITLLKRESITHLVSKNAGGDATTAKLQAARALGLAVVMIARPQKPECDTVTTVAAALDRLLAK